MSQNAQILEHLQAGKTITPLEALHLYDCWALSSRISNLVKAGHDIKTEMVSENGKNFARYRLCQRKKLLDFINQ